MPSVLGGTPVDVAPATVAAYAIAVDLERDFARAHRETGGQWPDSCCVEASVSLYDELAHELPEARPLYVWGQFFVGERHPNFPSETTYGHAWVECQIDGTLLDLTAGQFTRGPALAIVTRSSALRTLYREETRGLPRSHDFIRGHADRLRGMG